MVICSKCGREVKKVVKGLCVNSCYHTVWGLNNPDKYEAEKENIKKRVGVIRRREIRISEVSELKRKYTKKYYINIPNTCDMLKQHASDLKDDPERLSTEFLQKIIGVKCKKELK